MSFGATVIILQLVIYHVSAQADGNFWWKDLNVSTESSTVSVPTTTQIPLTEPIVHCECVPFYICNNGSIDTSGAGLIDTRSFTEINDERCVDIMHICCKPPLAPEEEDPKKEIEHFNHLPPDTQCLCLVWQFCPVNLIVSDGLGKTNITIDTGFQFSHSSCDHTLHACCAIQYVEDNAITTFSATILSAPTKNTITKNTTSEIKSKCECVEPYLCDEYGYIRTDGNTLIAPRSLMIPRCPTDPDLSCCKVKDDHNATMNITEEPTTTSSSTESPKKTTICGQRNSQGIGLRINGFEDGQSQFGEFPWVAMVLRKESIGNLKHTVFQGGGTIIHPRVILTTAHKVLENFEYWIRVGEWDAGTDNEVYPHQEIQVEKVFIHPKFNPGSLWHDVALLFLKDEIELNSHVSTICLAKNMSLLSHKGCVINGWGTDSLDEGTFQIIMKSLELPLVSHSDCQSMLRKTRLGRYFKLHESFICAGGEEGQDACMGDGGGPLACPLLDNPTRYVLVGATAWGIGCGTKDVPGVYANIMHDKEWIAKTFYSQFPSEPPTTTTMSVTSKGRNGKDVTYDEDYSKSQNTFHGIHDTSVEEVIHGSALWDEDKPSKFKNKGTDQFKKRKKDRKKLKKMNKKLKKQQRREQRKNRD